MGEMMEGSDDTVSNSGSMNMPVSRTTKEYLQCDDALDQAWDTGIEINSEASRVPHHR